MSRFEIIEAKPYHVGRILRRLRKEHRAALDTLGMNVHADFRQVFGASSVRRAWLVDGELMAIGGVTGSLLSGTGYIWLALSEKARAFPIALVKEARKQLTNIMETHVEVTTTVLCSDPTAQRFARFLGFHTGHIPGVEGQRIPVGERGAYALVMGYHKEPSACVS